MSESRRLLIVEGDPELAEAMTAHFEDLGYDAHSCPDGLDAIMQIKSEPPRVVVMGLTTPRLGGVDTLRLLRRCHPGLSVVLADSGPPPGRSTGEPSARDRDNTEWRSLDRLVALASARPAPDPSSAPLAQASPEPAATAEAPEQPRVLVVDDLADIRELLRDILEAEGYAVEVAGDAATALSRLASLKPHVVLLDISMPALSGIAALQQLRARDPHVGVIMVTGHSDESLAHQTLALGAFDFIRKPIDFEYLRRSIQTLLAMRALVPDESRSEPVSR